MSNNDSQQPAHESRGASIGATARPPPSHVAEEHEKVSDPSLDSTSLSSQPEPSRQVPSAFHTQPGDLRNGYWNERAIAAPGDYPGSCSLNKMFNPSLTRDTTLTKVFVGGLAWQTKAEALHHHFSQYGDILEAVVIMDKYTGRSKGFGFVTFSDPESATKATSNANPVIDNRRTNCNLAYMGAQKPRASATKRSDYETFEPQSYSVPGNMSMQLQYQVPGAQVGFSPVMEAYHYDYSSDAAASAPVPFAYNTYDTGSTSSSPMFSPYPTYFIPPTPPSPAYYYPSTPGSMQQLRISQFSPENQHRFVSVPTGPSGAPMQGPPPPLALPNSHPAAVPLAAAPPLATLVEGAPSPAAADSAAKSSSAPGQPQDSQQGNNQQPAANNATAPASGASASSAAADPYNGDMSGTATFAQYPTHLPYMYPSYLLHASSSPPRRGGQARYSAHRVPASGAHGSARAQQSHQPNRPPGDPKDVAAQLQRLSLADPYAQQ